MIDSKLRKWLQSKNLFDLNESDGTPRIEEIGNEDLRVILGLIGYSEDSDLGNCLIIPFDYGNLNLGRFIIWGTRNPELDNGGFCTTSNLIEWISAWYLILSDIFYRNYRATKGTYLPSYYSVGWKRVAILFADIRNFTPMTEMLRNAYSHKMEAGPLQQIIFEFCSKMAGLIQEETIQKENRGRVDKFLGDGIMAVFGEYDFHPSKVVCNAVYVACNMINTFYNAREKWQEDAFGKGYELEFNEAVEIDLGIGIDFGHVLFGYLGDGTHLEYGAIGDHVNFAQRLVGEAAKVNLESGEKRPNILMSRTAFRCCEPWLKDYQEVKLSPKGKGYEYTCYGIDPENFDEAHFRETEKNGSWDDAWISGSYGPSPLSFLNDKKMGSSLFSMGK